MRRAHHLVAAGLTAAALSLAPTTAFADTTPGAPADHPVVTTQPDDRRTDDHKADDQKADDHKADDQKADSKDRSDRDKDHGDRDRDRDHGTPGDRDRDHDHGMSGDHDGEHRPHGGVHTGGGFGALTADHSLATGGVLLAGGLVVGALALRRRKPAPSQA
ncbi:hypothetical protein [Kitasatospora viridis]|uniref:LPXTG-motif cell wall-anchored protein n=1 Tax=Kitasatospora viridis TaxID=281105 RepID=A0A561UNT6_9ACTN|nr:hypothetical protein [Kitasatospora viridis]TWG00994.1 hypothetical protein FHX73_114875 [Kitasatospora viridis]